MPDIWVISDTHFGHAKIIEYGERPYKELQEMDNDLVDRWNSVVKPGDKVYHLGDVYFSRGWEALNLCNGRKRLILGNHDNAKDQHIMSAFEKIYVWRMWPELGLLMTHVPVHESTLAQKKLHNVHGHIHQNASPAGPYTCVSVEHINYTPINIEELRIR